MRFITLFLLYLTALAPLSAQRSRELINFDWKFSKGEFENAANADFDDSEWQTVHLPHDASISGPFVRDSLNSDRKNGFLPRQKGWYRKVLNVENNIENKKVFIEFEGIYRDAHIFVNGNEVAHQLNGYEGFLVDVTDVIKQGDNILAVSYDNTDMESSRWYNGEGIYRDAWLLITEMVHVDYHGTYITTPSVTKELSTVFIQTEVINETDKELDVTVISGVFSPENIKVDEITDRAPLLPGELYHYRQNAKIEDPQFWDIESPELYNVITTVKVNDKIYDKYESAFGVRTIEFHRDKGLLLNGRKVIAKGLNIHHDLGPLGAAAFERGFERRLEGLKKLGCNAIRLSHNPHDKFILDWCDRNGMLVMDEAFDKWEDQFFGEGNDFDEHWRASLTAFVKRDRNHPCIFLWSVGNETQQQKSAKHGYGVPRLKELVNFMHNFEPSRKVTCGLHPSRKSGAYGTKNYYREGPPEMEFYMDVVSTNYREEFWPVDKDRYPQLIFILSEAQAGNLGNEWFNFNHDNSVGLFYWGGTDYIGESFGWPSKGWPNGIIDWNDHWKPFSYYINSLFSKEPMVHITVYDPGMESNKYWNEVQLRFQPMFSHWNWENNDSVRLLTFTNCHEVELFVNGKSAGIKQVPEEYYTKDIKAHSAEEFDPDDPVLTGPEMHKKLEWVIPYEAGTVMAEGKIDGKVVARHELKITGDASKIVLEADRKKIRADGLDLSYITVKVVDENNLIIPDAAHNITFSVSGAGINAGVGNADLLSNEPFVADQRKAFQGKALLIVRSKRESGKIKITAKAEGLQPADIEIIAE